MDLMVVEPSETCHVKVGVFTFVKDGKPDTADFYVICEPDDSTEAEARNMEAYNVQITDMWIKLIDTGYKNIRYTEVEPFPLC
jgi:hypothetical protein